MLQQTQVVKVIEYFDRFITAMPTLDDLANAEEQQVLALWSGLGYYNRARNLHKSALICQQQHQSQLPQDLSALIELPGIGRSTAAAIMSLAYGQPEPIMDGNVKRVFARHFLVAGEPNKSSTLKTLWQLAETHKETSEPAAYTQGLMDLGATICTKNKPQCSKCPVSSSCQAKARNVIAAYPEKKTRVKQQQVELHALMAVKQDRVALQQRSAKGIWPQLWFLPTFSSQDELKSDHQEAQHQFSLTHKLTHRILNIHVYQATWPDDSTVVWTAVHNLADLPHPKALIHIIEQHDNHQLH